MKGFQTKEIEEPKYGIPIYNIVSEIEEKNYI